MIKYLKNLVLFAALAATGQCVRASGADSSLLRVRDYIAQKIQDQISENAERVKKGLPKNYIVFADARVLKGETPNQDPRHVVRLRQAHTTEETIEGVWDFSANHQLQTLSAQLDTFSRQNGYDYYMVIAAIYNIDDDYNEKTDFSKLSWSDIDGVNDSGSVKLADDAKALQYYTTDGNNKFSKLAGMVYHKMLPLAPNALYHFVITTYFPFLPGNSTALVGRVAHLQTIINADPTKNKVYNEAFARYWQSLAIPTYQKAEYTKENWLLAGVTATQDFIAVIRNFKESDILAIDDQEEMIDYLKDLQQPKILLSGISFHVRKHIINTLNKNELHDSYWLPLWDDGQGGENAMLAAIETTPGTQADSLQTLLSDSTYKLLKDLNDKFDDAGMWGTGDNYTKFVQSIARILASGLTPDRLANILTSGRIYKLGVSASGHSLVNVFGNDLQKEADKQLLNATGGGVFQRNYSTIGVNLDDVTAYWLKSYSETWSYDALADVYNKQAQDNTYVASLAYNKELYDDKAAPPVSVPMHPFDMILVIPQKDFTINGFTLSKGSFQPIPMYYYYWLRKKHDNQQWIDVAEGTGNVLLAVSMVTGIGEIIEGGNLAVQFCRGAQVLFDAKILLNSVSDGAVDKWLREKLGEEGYNVYKFIEYTYLIYTASKGGIALARNAGPAVKNAATRLYEIMKNNRGLLSNLKTNASELYTAFRNYFKNVLGRDLEEAAGVTGFARYTRVAVLAENVLAKLTELNLSAGLLQKLDDALAAYPGLAGELAGDVKLLDHFVGMQTKWYYRIGLARAYIVTGEGSITLPGNFANLLKDLEMANGVTLRSMITAGNVASDLGNMLENGLTRVLVQAFRGGISGIRNADIPADLKTYYEGIYNAGYTKVLSQVTIMTPQGKFPIPDFFFCKTATDLTGEEVLNLADIIYHDSKLYAGTAFTTAQKQIEQVMKAAKAAGIKAEFVLGEDLVFEGQTYLQGTKISIKEMSKVATEVVNGNVELTRTVKVIVP